MDHILIKILFLLIIISISVIIIDFCILITNYYSIMIMCLEYFYILNMSIVSILIVNNKI